MKKIFILIFVFPLFLANLNAQFQYPYYFDAKSLDANYINVPLTNYGNLDSRCLLSDINTLEYYDGALWSHYKKEKIVFDHGLFFIGKINGEKRIAQSLWNSLFTPGPIIDGKPARLANPSDSLRYRVYKISADDRSDLDLKDWPVDLGAPACKNGMPKLYADQTIWTVYNALDSQKPRWSNYNQSKYPVTPVEIHQTAYAYKVDKSNPGNYLNDIVFFEWQVINKGKNSIDSAVIGLWTDIDFYGEHNFPAIDTTLQLGYCWSDYRRKNQYGTIYDSSKIPAVGYVMLYGPSVPSNGDTAVFKGIKKINFRNLPLSSFWGVFDDSYSDESPFGPAYSIETSWNIAHGLDKKGTKTIDPISGKPTSFEFAGDPLTNTGWLADKYIGVAGGAGFYLFSGNFTLAPSDTQWVMFALVAANGGDNLKSISEIRKKASFLRSEKYENLVRSSELEYRQSTAARPARFELFQNYPNPFNNRTMIIYKLQEKSSIKIELFNLLGYRLRTLFTGTLNSGYHQISLSAESLPSGVYFYKISTNDDSATLTKKLILIK